MTGPAVRSTDESGQSFPPAGGVHSALRRVARASGGLEFGLGLFAGLLGGFSRSDWGPR